MGEFKKIYIYNTPGHKDDEVGGYLHNETGHYIEVEFAKFRNTVKFYRVKTERFNGELVGIFYSLEDAKTEARRKW